jgi:hypothetical protein
MEGCLSPILKKRWTFTASLVFVGSLHLSHLLRRFLRIEGFGIERAMPFQHLFVSFVLRVGNGGELVGVAPGTTKGLVTANTAMFSSP